MTSVTALEVQARNMIVTRNHAKRTPETIGLRARGPGVDSTARADYLRGNPRSSPMIGRTHSPIGALALAFSFAVLTNLAPTAVSGAEVAASIE